MSGLGIPVLINPNRSYWLSSIGNDVIHSTIQVQELDASIGRFSTLFADNIYSSTLNVSTLGASEFDVSGMYVSSIRGNTAFFSTMTLASDLSGGLGYVRFSVDASGIQVDGDPIRFDNLVYLTSTINIVQVSTIIDSDIFASNGYFSTLSTGNFSANIASLNQVNISSLYVSSLEGFDISGAQPVEWSLYPTLNSSITFQPNYVLSNVSNKLYFAGQEITDLSGGGSSWSLFPAVSSIQANNNPIVGLSSIKFQDSASLYSLTGNDLFYNGQPIAYGNSSNVSQWANYAAVNNVNMNTSSLNNVGNIGAVNLALSGSNITNGNTFTGSLSVGGTSLISLASINGLGQLSCQDIEVSNPGTGLADVNIYGATALPGDSALYVQGGVQFDGGSIHGFSAGVIPVAGVNTGRIDMLQAGFNLLHPLVGNITTGAALGITAGGALSLAGGGYVEMNTSTLQMINTTQGNKNTTIQAGFLTVDPDIAPFSSIKLFNTLGGGVEIDGGGQGSLTGFSTLIGNNLSTINLQVSTINGVPLSSIQTPANIVCSNINVGFSSIANAYYGNDFFTPGTANANIMLANQGTFLSSSVVQGRVQNLNVLQNITGFSAGGPIVSQIVNFSSIQSGTLSTINLRVSTINGLPWDISGDTGNTFNQLFTSSLQVSSLVGTGFEPYKLVNIYGNGLQFVSSSAVYPTRMLSSLNFIYSPGDNLTVEASTINLAHLTNGYVRLGGGTARDTFFYGSIQSTNIVQLSSIQTSGFCDISGGVRPTTDYILQDQRSIVFSDGSGNPTFQSRRTVASEEMVSFVNSTPEGAGNNSAPISASAFWAAPGTGGFGGAKFYGDFPGDNWGIDIVDENGNTLFETINSYDTGGINFQTNVYGVSSIVGYTAPGGSSAVGIDNKLTVPTLSTQALLCSTINGNNPTIAYTTNLQLSSMNLYQNSTTLTYWGSTITSSNINTSGYDVVVGATGVYKIGCSYQLNNTNTTDRVNYFFLKNDVPLDLTGSITSIVNNSELVTYSEIIEPMNNGDKIQTGLYTASADIYLSTMLSGVAAVPDSPAAILTMYKIN